MLRKLPYAVAIVALLAGVSLALAHTHFPFGPDPSYTGAPMIAGGDPEANCTSCHLELACPEPPCNLNLPGGGIEILDLPATYEAGQTYPLRVRLWSDSTAAYPERLWGFEITAVRRADGTGIGNWVRNDPDTLRVIPGIAPFETRSYLEHKLIGTRPGLGGPVEWQFNWQAPSTPQGDALFYVAGNAANGNGQLYGDFIYLGADTVVDATTPALTTTWGRLKAKYR